MLIRRANAEAELARPAAGLPLAEEALAVATGVSSLRLEVLARLSIARCAPERAPDELRTALARADAENDFTLVGAIARAAEAHAVALPIQRGPMLRRDQ